MNHKFYLQMTFQDSIGVELKHSMHLFEELVVAEWNQYSCWPLYFFRGKLESNTHTMHSHFLFLKCYIRWDWAHTPYILLKIVHFAIQILNGIMLSEIPPLKKSPLPCSTISSAWQESQRSHPAWLSQTAPGRRTLSWPSPLPTLEALIGQYNLVQSIVGGIHPCESGGCHPRQDKRVGWLQGPQQDN